MGKDDPKDPNGKLDLDKVEGIVIADIGQIFVQTDDNFVSQLVSHKLGSHTLLIDDLTISTESLAEAPITDSKETLLDNSARPQISWLMLGQGEMSKNDEKAVGNKLKITYRQSPGKVMGLVKSIPTGVLKGKDLLSFSLVSEKPAKLMIQLEEHGGGKYNVIVETAGGKEAKEISRALIDFLASQDSNDDNNALNLDQVQQIIVVDLSGIIDMADADNTLWIGRLRAK